MTTIGKEVDDAYNRLVMEIDKLDLKTMKDICVLLNNDYDPHNDIIMNVVMKRLENLMSEEDYVEFCDKLSK